ncbi:MAG TPA: rhodanese-like domain-containing protein [Gemmataceae bacterium]|jgi:rhodanese-related sulfurtransferase|nr:rhodanese-like domain-containing protein [Gemmataceae bacterium]
MWRLTLFLAPAMVTLAPAIAVAELQQAPAKPKEYSGGPYCGIYSLYAALRIHGIEISFADLAQSKYVGSEYGSSLAELKLAAEEHGARALPLEGMTATTLRASQYPILLHVRRPGRNTPYLHWVLFLGVNGNRARIVDPPFAEEEITLAEMLALWDGVGLVISKEPVSRAELFWPAWAEIFVMLGLIAVLAGAMFMTARRSAATWSANRWRPVSRIGLRAAAIMTAAGIMAFLWHSVHDEGFLRNTSARALVAAHDFDVALPTLAVADVEQLRREGNAVLLDARFPEDYAKGHIPDAVNLPVTSGLGERHKILDDLPEGVPVIVYCQGQSCTWADMVAADLVFRGYKNVAVYRGGYAEWEKRERERKHPAP